MIVNLDKLFSQLFVAVISCLGGAYVFSVLLLPAETLMPYGEVIFAFASWPLLIIINALIAIIFTANILPDPVNAVPGPLFSTYIVGRECGLWEPVEPYNVPRRLNRTLCLFRDCLTLFGLGSLAAQLICLFNEINAPFSRMELIGATAMGMLCSAVLRTCFLWFRKRRVLKLVATIQECQRSFRTLPLKEEDDLIRSLTAGIW